MEKNARLIAAICRRVDGLPLAIEMAAARVKILSPSAMLDLLERRLPLLTGAPRDLPERQQTMWATIAWSYDLLSPGEQRFLRHIAVFVGGFTLQAAEEVAVLDPDETGTVLDFVSSLVDQSLIRRMPTSDDTPRYLMMETIREFAEDALNASDEVGQIRERQAEWCVEFADHVAPALGPMLDPGAMTRTEAEHANIRAALTWAMETGRADIAMPLAAGMGWFWYLRGYTTEGLQWLSRALAMPHGEGEGDTRRMALIHAGALATETRPPAAVAWLEEARVSSRESQNRHSEGQATLLLGILAEDDGDYTRAKALFLEARELFADPSEWWFRLCVQYHVGVVALGQGSLAEATALLEDVEAEAQARGDTLLPVWSLDYLALISSASGDLARTLSVFAQMRSLSPGSSDARAEWRDSFMIAAVGITTTLGDFLTAAQLLGGIAARPPDLRKVIYERDLLVRYEEAVRQRLGETAFNEAWERGEKMPGAEWSVEVNRLLAALEQSISRSPAGDTAFGLTARELDVLRLLAAGRSNEQIGIELFISPRTAQLHITHILAKLSLSNRTQAAAFAHTHHLV
jgi:non-specific serine/threonine protein kinase